MRRVRPIRSASLWLVTVVTLAAFPGCAGVTAITDLHDSRAEDHIISLRLGESREVLVHQRGLIWGGVSWGLLPAHAGIVRIDYRETGHATHATITALAPGQTEIFYVNRLSHPPQATLESLPPARAEDWTGRPGFTVAVTP